MTPPNPIFDSNLTLSVPPDLEVRSRAISERSKNLIVQAGAGTGKTTIINIIIQFFGKQNISGVELQKLDDKFEIEKTRNKLINIFDDLSSKPIKYVGNFKGLVTNSSMRGRIKHIQNEIEWRNRCKGLFACNVLPQIKEYF